MAANRRFQIEQIDDVTVVHLSDSDLSQRDANLEFRSELLDHLQKTGSSKIVVNMKGVRRLTSETINSLMRARNQVASKDGEIRLCDVPAEVREVLVLLKLDGVLRIYDSTEAAFRDLPEK